VALFGLRPTLLSYRQDYGLYEEDGMVLNVSGGIGGLIPFRFGVPPEINVIILHQSLK
jgi:predicted MPP superfamily phosphohydrolase